MPSPFPGMDPFLEHPDVFPDFHARFVAYLSEALQMRLPPPYLAGIGRRAWIEVSERFVEPDVQLLRPRGRAGMRTTGGSGRRHGPAHPAGRDPRSPRRARRTLVEIFIGRGADRRLVTSIEVLSLSNKTPGEHGEICICASNGRSCRARCTSSEIDLLRGGEHTTAVPRRRLVKAVGTFDYHVSIHHFDNLEDYFVYAFGLREPLPSLAIPLLPDDPAVSLDLQAVFLRTYDAGPYSARSTTARTPCCRRWRRSRKPGLARCCANRGQALQTSHRGRVRTRPGVKFEVPDPLRRPLPKAAAMLDAGTLGRSNFGLGGGPAARRRTTTQPSI